jgi:hypothetical protein
MLTQEILVEIHVLHRQGKSIRSIENKKTAEAVVF